MGLFGNENSSQIKKLKKIADKVMALEEKYKDYYYSVAKNKLLKIINEY